MTPEGKIAAEARTALLVGVVSIWLVGLVFGPAAIYRAYRVRVLIELHQVGYVHLARARHALILGITGTAISLVVAVVWMV